MLFLLAEQDGLENKLAQIKHVIRLKALAQRLRGCRKPSGRRQETLAGRTRSWASRISSQPSAAHPGPPSQFQLCRRDYHEDRPCLATSPDRGVTLSPACRHWLPQPQRAAVSNPQVGTVRTGCVPPGRTPTHHRTDLCTSGGHGTSSIGMTWPVCTRKRKTEMLCVQGCQPVGAHPLIRATLTSTGPPEEPPSPEL